MTSQTLLKAQQAISDAKAKQIDAISDAIANKTGCMTGSDVSNCVKDAPVALKGNLGYDRIKL